jgi:FAD/FMN-containing dehydrogenase
MVAIDQIRQYHPTSTLRSASTQALLTDQHLSWGRVQRQRHYLVPLRDKAELPAVIACYGGRPILGYGLGRSYGDSCLNQDGVLIDMSNLNKIIEFDSGSGDITCEAGVTLAQILADVAKPREDGSAWFLPVSPGTRFVTVGGAIANDVHGKNHHLFGTFGCHVRSLELLRSDGSVRVCSPEQNVELFRATIGGLGLTGLILSAILRLRPASSLMLEVEKIRFDGIDEFHALARDSQASWEYTVAWMDCIARGGRPVRGMFTRANHAPLHTIPVPSPPSMNPRFSIPFALPFCPFNRFTTRALNLLYARELIGRRVLRRIDSYEGIFYPLDAIGSWNRLYGRRGFFQYQCVVPPTAQEAITELLQCIAVSGETPVLAVIKTFGDVPSAGMLSFPCEGTTLALDFPHRGRRTLEMLDRLDSVTVAAGGRVYPAKDGRMSAALFQRYYPHWMDFARFVDPGFGSSFQRRVMPLGRSDGQSLP